MDELVKEEEVVIIVTRNENAYFAEAEIESISIGGIVKIRFNETVVSHNDFKDVFANHLKVVFVQHGSSIIELETEIE